MVVFKNLWKRFGDFLINIYGLRCHYCGVKVIRVEYHLKNPPYNLATIDHKKPKSKGGSDNLNNLIIACRKCNQEKRDLDYQKFRKSKESIRKGNLKNGN